MSSIIELAHYREATSEELVIKFLTALDALNEQGQHAFLLYSLLTHSDKDAVQAFLRNFAYATDEYLQKQVPNA